MRHASLPSISSMINWSILVVNQIIMKAILSYVHPSLQWTPSKSTYRSIELRGFSHSLALRNCSPGSIRICRLGVSQAQKAKKSGDERRRLHSVCPQLSFCSTPIQLTGVDAEHVTIGRKYRWCFNGDSVVSRQTFPLLSCGRSQPSIPSLPRDLSHVASR